MIILDYFTLTDRQAEQFALLDGLYRDWNSKINVISRKDIDHLYDHHILHSLALAEVLRFQPGSRIIDVGTGGGFPGAESPGDAGEIVAAPVAAVDRQHQVADRIEDEKRQYDFVVSRGVMPLPDLVKLTRKNILRTQRNALPNGWLILKGGDLRDELKPFRNIAEMTPINGFFSDEWFEEKYVIYLPSTK